MTTLPSAFSEKEAIKMVISTCSSESEMLHNFYVNFSKMIGIANVKVIPMKFMKRFPVRTI